MPVELRAPKTAEFCSSQMSALGRELPVAIDRSRPEEDGRMFPQWQSLNYVIGRLAASIIPSVRRLATMPKSLTNQVVTPLAKNLGSFGFPYAS